MQIYLINLGEYGTENPLLIYGPESEIFDKMYIFRSMIFYQNRSCISFRWVEQHFIRNLLYGKYAVFPNNSDVHGTRIEAKFDALYDDGEYFHMLGTFGTGNPWHFSGVVSRAARLPANILGVRSFTRDNSLNKHECSWSLLPAAWPVEGEQLQCRQNGLNLI